jgi:CheY-like chemotaxis protein
MGLLLERRINYRLFQSARQALDHANNSPGHEMLLRRVYSSYKTGPFDSDTLTHIDINAIHKEIYNPERFSIPSVIVLDYSMPEMNGLEFCASLTNPYLKKILLTGQADTELAVQAFNAGLIDQFISKKDQNLERKLNQSIATLQQHYFNRSFKLISDPIIASGRSRFITNPQFIQYFNGIREQNSITEYYLLDEPYSGFLLLDTKGELSLLLILAEEKMQNHIEKSRSNGAPPQLLQHLQDGTMIPLFNVAEGNEEPETHRHSDWQPHHTASQKIAPGAPYYAALITGEDLFRVLPDLCPSGIRTLSDYLSAPAGSGKLLH